MKQDSNQSVESISKSLAKGTAIENTIKTLFNKTTKSSIKRQRTPATATEKPTKTQKILDVQKGNSVVPKKSLPPPVLVNPKQQAMSSAAALDTETQGREFIAVIYLYIHLHIICFKFYNYIQLKRNFCTNCTIITYYVFMKKNQIALFLQEK